VLDPELRVRGIERLRVVDERGRFRQDAGVEAGAAIVRRELAAVA
jgi:hypothetical protein